MAQHWLTPEEMKQKKENRKKLLYAIILLGAIGIGIIATYATNAML